VFVTALGSLRGTFDDGGRGGHRGGDGVYRGGWFVPLAGNSDGAEGEGDEKQVLHFNSIK